MKRRIISIIFLAIMVCTLAVSVAAATIQPRLNNTAMTSTNFTITSSGKATITASYTGYKNVTTGATVTSYIEKRTLGMFWTRVDIGEIGNAWVDTSTDDTDAFGHVFYLSERGTYRAIVEYEIRGTGGATDVINYEQERTY